jgi:hypothetical protein
MRQPLHLPCTTAPLTYPALFCQYRHNEMRNTSWRFSTPRQHGNVWHMKHKRQLAHLIQRKLEGHNTINKYNEIHIVIYSYHPSHFRHCISFTRNLFPEMHKIIMQSSIFSVNQINVREFYFCKTSGYHSSVAKDSGFLEWNAVVCVVPIVLKNGNQTPINTVLHPRRNESSVPDLCTTIYMHKTPFSCKVQINHKLLKRSCKLAPKFKNIY